MKPFLKTLFDAIAGFCGLPTFRERDELRDSRETWKDTAKSIHSERQELKDGLKRLEIQSAERGEAIRQFREILNKVPV